jgi:hypothetical protein
MLYRLLTFDTDGEIYRSEEPYESEEEALDHVAASDLLHRLTDWEIKICSCGWGRIYSKGGIVRGIHLELDDDSAALAAGLLAQASLPHLEAVGA